MKNLLLLFSLLVSSVSLAQVGVNNTSPKATMDITAQTTDGSKPEGLIAPRLTGSQLNLAGSQYGSAQTGTIVYVTSADPSPSGKTVNVTASGYYYYDGSVWQKIISGATGNDNTNDAWVNDSGNSMVKLGTQSNGSTARAAGTELVITDNGSMGIGTSTPSTKLDVQGNVRIGTVSSSQGASNVSSLVRDNTTGEIKVSTSSTGNTANITFVNYQLQNVDKDWVADFNTNISASQYTVTVVGSTFSIQALSSGAGGTYNPLNVAAKIVNGTWRLSADYSGGSTSSNGTWTINCMIVNNSITKTIPNIVADLGGSSTGAIASPSGL